MTASAVPAPTTDDDVERSLLAFLEKKTKTSWEVDRDLFAVGGLSSLFAMELVVHLEQSFAIAIGGPDLKLDNFRTVRAMIALVARLRAPDGE
ncbi:methoxymalonate biosynthesis acyl carrier protein [Nocardia tenerifensis]|uniref:Methoxymalonate biosynthesis acyl carrier protein n=1 Tax=Nocardia tenerifensis TaxID=228006 RepID=A0A318KH32_9NOCA|nr:acyl carrier protein [Nocardia tenerifensis]PXX71483.1 methoxymalonate biosynthesis acyl carrier protein [Nocardia tenerifensis]